MGLPLAFPCNLFVPDNAIHSGIHPDFFHIIGIIVRLIKNIGTFFLGTAPGASAINQPCRRVLAPSTPPPGLQAVPLGRKPLP
jgi:hypothetical protein